MDTISNINKISGNIADILNNRVFSGTLEIENGIIVNITEDNKKYDNYIIPGLIDSHIHIESSMLIPSEFARIAPVHGTVAVVADPHEIANVLGVEGVKFMIENGKKVPFKFYFEAPSCVPATAFETSGANIDADQIKELLKEQEIIALGEMMNIPGVLSDDPQVMGKINAAKKYGKPIDGHSPDLRGENLKKYINAGISTDHECYEKEEALEKIKFGMKILIREGSAAKDFDALSSLIEEYPDFCMFASDDKHPNDLVKGHINLMVKKALKLGYDKMKVLQCACINPVKHYMLDTGLLQIGDKADFIVIDDFDNFKVLKTVIDGKLVAENGWCLVPKVKTNFVNNFQAKLKKSEDFVIKYTGKKVNVIEALNGLLVTNKLHIDPKVSNNNIISDIEMDILKIAVINRYNDTIPSVALVKNFGFKKGAIASSVAHDSHNIIAVGVSDEDITKAVNLVIKNKGGLSVVHDDFEMALPLPVAGLMTDTGAYKVAESYTNIEKEAKNLGSNLDDPFMTLSFMALLVIPDLKISDKGLFDVNKFKFIGIDEE